MSRLDRIAMWSGPRNISTAMMRSFEARGDCVVEDEPFYARYLTLSGARHPMREQVIASQPHAAPAIMRALTRTLPDEITVHYQKHMAHHMVGDVDIGWFDGFVHCFLVRDPAAMIASYRKKRETVSAADLGLSVQRRIYTEVADASGIAPPVIDASDVLRDPRVTLGQLCTRLGLDYRESMLQWLPGLRATDGVWGPHWYNAVTKTTGFEPYKPSDVQLDGAELRVLEACLPDYEFFMQRRIVPTS